MRNADAQIRKTLDPVCGMEIDPAKTKHEIEYESETYYFCSQSCRERFEQDPEKYVPSPYDPDLLE